MYGWLISGILLHVTWNYSLANIQIARHCLIIAIWLSGHTTFILEIVRPFKTIKAITYTSYVFPLVCGGRRDLCWSTVRACVSRLYVPTLVDCTCCALCFRRKRVREWAVSERRNLLRRTEHLHLRLHGPVHGRPV